MSSFRECPNCGTVHSGGHDEKVCALEEEQFKDKTAKAETDEDNPGSLY